MFEAFNKSQPKLVYTYAGHHHPKDERPSTTCRTLVTVTSEGIVQKPETRKAQETIAQKHQQIEAMTQILNIQQPQTQQQKVLHKCQQQTKEELDQRERMKPYGQTKQTKLGEFVPPKKYQNVDQTEKKPLEHQKQLEIISKGLQPVKHEVDCRETKQLEQQRQPKQIDVGYMSTKKVSTICVVQTKKDNIQMKLSEGVDNEHDKTSTQHPLRVNNSDTFRSDSTSTFDTQKGQVKNIRFQNKLSDFGEVKKSLKPASAISAENKVNFVSASTPSEFQSSSIHSKFTHGHFVPRPEPPTTNNTAPKQIFKHSPLVIGSQQTQQHGPSHEQEQQNTLQPQTHNKPIGDSTKEFQEAKLHVTAIKVQSYPMERKQTWPLIPSSGNQLPEKPRIQTHDSLHSKSLTFASQIKFPEETWKSEIGHDSPLSTDSAQSPNATSSVNPPKSILKNSTSFDHSELSLCSPAPTFSDEPDSVIHPSFDFSKDTISLRKGSSSIFKRQIQSPFNDKIVSPPPQRKGRKPSESSLSKDDGAVLKKSVTFDSEVRLHEDDHISIFKTLSVEA